MSIQKFVAYYRVSTQKQGESGLGLAAQQKTVLDYIGAGPRLLAEEFTEIESGKDRDRPVLAAALASCRRYRAVLVIAKLDRLARDAAFLLNLRDAGVEFVAVDMPTANRLTVGIMALVAEQEREAISIRTKAALAAAKERGVALGTPANLSNRDLGTARSAEVRATKSKARASDLMPVVLDLQAAGIVSVSGIARVLNQRGIAAPRGGLWSAVQVQRLLGRVSEQAISR